ncbi:2-phosphoglycolate phosphatase, prokaryotic [Hoeflea phototrophica DFL-43]|uniref:Phosphoglycolate phosphatase n=1 Tax=Hoeflea phototrophica (strain DSM 17068 / NCIMB 14078 / DFL-43) TaxID=411684 RepID=A9D6L0_HOEPD|nr:HAD family hydrolase [Hoeflea phototrophica]EDQ33533.1 2-phosphoglycolate phosphatase, prokaryotic [Hoeflea phototrophica DFL-43]
MTETLVIFDLDGTLIDTAPDLIASLNHVMDLSGHAHVAFEDITWLVGQGALAMIERAWSLHGHPASPEQLHTAFDAFLVHYANNMPGQSQPYPGLVAALDRLEAAGMQLAVCTNKTEALARRLLDRLDLTSRFAAITGGDTFAVKKPHGDHILGTIEKAGGSVGNAVMIGDSINDILAAQNARIPAIGVPFGYSDKPVETFNPDVVISHFDKLEPALIKQLVEDARPVG